MESLLLLVYSGPGEVDTHAQEMFALVGRGEQGTLMKNFDSGGVGEEDPAR
jgi:hypothetical protein